MKYLVLKSFRDKFSKIYYGANGHYETNDKERVKVLQKAGYISKESNEKVQKDEIEMDEMEPKAINDVMISRKMEPKGKRKKSKNDMDVD